jgi:hypothetical protein
MTLEERFLVFNRADVKGTLTHAEWGELNRLANKISLWRMHQGKSVNRYVVINEDEPYFSEVLQRMERHDKGE